MQVLYFKHWKLDQITEHCKYVLDGVLPATGSNLITFPFACFPNRRSDYLIRLEDFYVGLNFHGSNTWTNNPLTLDVNVWREFLSVADITDANVGNADEPQSVPVGFNQFNGSVAEYARWGMNPRATAGFGETIQCDLSIKFGQPGGQANYPKITVEFVKKLIPIFSQ